MNVALIDNADSFTWNLYQQIRSLGADCRVYSASELTAKKIKNLKADRIVISAGPHHPKDAHASLAVLKLHSARIPILGVCLGHQCLGIASGSRRSIAHAPIIFHGKTSLIRHTGDSIFAGLPSPLRVGRYHSLVLSSLPKNFELLAWSGSKKTPEVIMAIRHECLPVFGVQFHPESFLTQSGDRLMKNFLQGSW